MFVWLRQKHISLDGLHRVHKRARSGRFYSGTVTSVTRVAGMCSGLSKQHMVLLITVQLLQRHVGVPARSYTSKPPYIALQPRQTGFNITTARPANAHAASAGSPDAGAAAAPSHLLLVLLDDAPALCDRDELVHAEHAGRAQSAGGGLGDAMCWSRKRLRRGNL